MNTGQYKSLECLKKKRLYTHKRCYPFVQKIPKLEAALRTHHPISDTVPTFTSRHQGARMQRSWGARGGLGRAAGPSLGPRRLPPWPGPGRDSAGDRERGWEPQFLRCFRRPGSCRARRPPVSHRQTGARQGPSDTFSRVPQAPRRNQVRPAPTGRSHPRLHACVSF